MDKKERIDDLQYNGLKLIQNPDGFCFGCDAVELANFTFGNKNAVACDLGSGSGILSVLLAAKKEFNMTAVEIQKDYAELCQKNAELNNLSHKIKVLNMPMQNLPEVFEKGGFDIVVTNPPYQKLNTGLKSEAGDIAIARHEIAVNLKEVIQTAAYLLKFGGKFFVVYPIDRLAEVMTICTEYKLEPKILQILTPDAKKPPHLFLLSCTHGGKKGIKVLKEKIIFGNS